MWHKHATIDKRLFEYIRKVLPEGSTILELGSGWATGELAKHYKMYSVEHDPKYVGVYNSTYLEVPLCEHKQIHKHESTVWYDPTLLASKLKGIKYELLLVDGPVRVRSGFVKYQRLFDLNVITIFDDVDRSIDGLVVSAVARGLKRPYTVYSEGKSFAVLNDPIWEKK